MNERHVFKIQDEEGDRHQLYVFNIERTDNKITLKSIWLLVIHNGLETKIILNIPGLMEQMADDMGNKATPEANRVLESLFKDMVLAADGDLVSTQIEEDPTTELLDAAQKAEKIHNETFDDILARLNERKSTKH